MVGIEPRAGIAGEVFPATEHASGAESVIEGTGFFIHLRDTAAIATAAKRVVSFVVEGNVEHGAEVEIESK